MRKLLKSTFSTSVDLLSTNNMKKFLTGEFPEALSYSRPFKQSKTSNGIRVCSEILSSKISSLVVFINCGSRNESFQSSGTAHFLQHLHFKGTKNRKKQELELSVQNMGGTLNAYTSRENTCYMMTCFKDDLSKSVEIVGDMLTNSLYQERDVENERSTIKRELVETRKAQPLETTIEISHRGIFKNHQMGLPILGDISNMETISKAMIENFHQENYFGENIIIVGVGDIHHQQFVTAVEKYFQVPKLRKTVAPERTKPQFHEGISSLSSTFTNLVNMVTISEAPSFFDNQFFAYLLLQRVISDRPDNPFELEIMKNSTSFRFQKHLAPYTFIKQQKGFYSSYWDTGLYGNYFLVEPARALDAYKLSIQGYQLFSNKITDEELERAKRRVYVEILNHQSQNDIAQSIANNIQYYDRRVQTKELGERIAAITTQQLQDIAKKIVKNHQLQKMHITAWGNLKEVPFLK